MTSYLRQVLEKEADLWWPLSEISPNSQSLPYLLRCSVAVTFSVTLTVFSHQITLLHLQTLLAVSTVPSLPLRKNAFSCKIILNRPKTGNAIHHKSVSALLVTQHKDITKSPYEVMYYIVMGLFPYLQFWKFSNSLVGITSLLAPLLFIISIQQRQWFQMWNQILLHKFPIAAHHLRLFKTSHFEACIIWFPTSSWSHSVYFCLFPDLISWFTCLTHFRLRVFAVAIPISSRFSQDWVSNITWVSQPDASLCTCCIC